MERLPRELLEEILVTCAHRFTKNETTPLRLVCREFDRVVKPVACRTIGLEYSKLSKSDGGQKLDPAALARLGDDCRSLYIDLMVVRDESEFQIILRDETREREC